MISDAIASAYANIELHGLDEDPIRTFRFSSDKQRMFVIAVQRFLETYLHSGNRFGKTTVGAAVSIALARGVAMLDGVMLPRVHLPATCLLLVPSYKQSVDSSIAIYRQMLGRHPHKVSYINRAAGWVDTFYIKPDAFPASVPFERWSKVSVFTHEGVIPEGMPADVAHADEPPPQSMWSPLRFRQRAGSPLYLYITATPKNRHGSNPVGWEWLMRKSEFAECLDKAVDGKIRIQGSALDNSAMPESQKALMVQKAEGDPHQKAILHGEHVDATGSPPYPLEQIERWKKAATEPERIPVHVSRVGDVDVEIYEYPRKGAIYYIPVDLSAGINDEDHDPCGFHVWDRQKRMLVARFNGFLPPYSVAILACKTARLYNNAKVDPENNSGWILSFLDGARDARYTNIAKERFWDKPKKKESERYGFNTGTRSRKEFVGALQRAVKKDDCIIRSAECLSNMAAVTLDGTDKVITAEHRGEDVILAGRGLWWCKQPLSEINANPSEERVPLLVQHVQRRRGRARRRKVGRIIRPRFA